MASGGTDNTFSGNPFHSVIFQVGTLNGGVHVSAPAVEPPLEPWARLVDDSKAWRSGQDRTSAVAVASHLAGVCLDLPGDPWLDRGLAERFTKRVSWLTLKLGIEFDAAEATLLTLIPLLHQVLWTRAAAERLDGPPPEFYRDHGRLAARMDGHDEVRWWLFHRWLWLRAEVLKPESIAGLLTGADLPPVLTADRVSGLLQGLRIEPNVLCGKQRLVEMRPQETLFGGTDDEERVRTPLLGLLLAVAYSMAIDITALSDIIVWHTPVDFSHLHETIASASWESRADCPVLSAVCHHASVVEALREHTVRLDALLHAVRQAADTHQVLAPLRSLPERASSDEVRPALGPDRKPVFSGWSRFRMDEQRVQELLMGEQLYRDRSLAIRELYQNALDACRYRRAREEYLRRTTGRSSSWSGQITFSQGISSDGRPYLDCTDNGVGMGLSELTGVFARAGARFADLAEFRDEQVDWSRLDPPIELHPNSRFGIGVLSYFMLADEITITTCRMSRYTGHPGPVYQVTITGPGHLFEIKELPTQGTPGTTIRLHLRSGIEESCVETLGRLLAIAEFDTTAQHGCEHSHWPAGIFFEGGYTREITVTDATGQVVWCESGGGLLVDGLHTGPRHGDTLGAFVNLTGHNAPRLSVDRTTILSDVAPVVHELQRAAIPDLICAGTLLTEEWLSRLGFDNPAVADMIAEQSPGHPIFPADKALVGESWPMPPHRQIDGYPLDHIFLWRLLARNDAVELTGLAAELAEAGPLLAAKPSDVHLLCAGRGYSLRWGSAEQLATPGHIFSIASIAGLSPRSTARRLSDLGIDGMEPDRFPAGRWQSYSTELSLLSRNHDRSEPWRLPGETVWMGQARAAASQEHISIAEATDILSSYGFTVAPGGKAAKKSYASLPELVRASIELEIRPEVLTDDALPEWLPALWESLCADMETPSAPIPPGAMLRMINHLGVPTAQAMERCRAAGLTPPDLPTKTSPEDVQLMSVRLNGSAPWLDVRRPVRLHHLIKAHARLNQSPFWAADRLAELGFTVPSENLPYYPEFRDLTLLRDARHDGGFLDPDKPVPLAHLVSVSRRLGQHITQVVDRLRELGMIVPDLATTIREALAKVPLQR
ncbi:hypothetical protein [Kutzneria sp. 744]|uniref:wHTH domain-containing protein n=1 Tax=Kutzneria sp. (strain 744) TaxID=345341 RepID=UPI0003EEA9D5|nr:hypothetical protein [Kutzneria sp. 744]EWM16527.1 ATP/GTP binding protein [Kutzneria sp. 744]